MMDWNGMTTWAWLWMGLWSIIAIAGLVTLAWWTVCRLDSRRNQSSSEILDGRYAAGKIDDEECDRRSKQLAKSP